MKKKKLFAVVLCGLLALSAVGGAAGCAASGEPATSEQSEAETVIGSEVVSGFEEEVQEETVLFCGDLNYVSEKDDKLDCSVLLTALEGTFAKDVAAEDILFGGGFQEVSDVKILENTKDTMEIGFVMPKNDLNAEDLKIDGSIELKEGVMIDKEGKSVTVAEEAAYTFRALDEKSILDGEMGYIDLTLHHKGAYYADFTVEMQELIDGKLKWVSLFDESDWEDHLHVPVGYKKTFGFANLKGGLRISAKSETGIFWDQYHQAGGRDFTNDELKSIAKINFTIWGTSLSPKGKITCYDDAGNVL